MKRTKAVAAILIWSGTAFGQDPAQAPPRASPSPDAGTLTAALGPDFGEASMGELIYSRYCAVCHGRSLKGDGPVAPGLKKKPTDLTELSSKNRGTFPFDKVAAMIDGRKSTRMHGTPDMPVWGEIFPLTTGTDSPDTDSAVKRITHYIWSKQATPADPSSKK